MRLCESPVYAELAVAARGIIHSRHRPGPTSGRWGRPTRLILTVVLCVGGVLALTGQAGATGDWDPDDVRGRYDFRWIGASYTPSGDITLTVVFYRGFRVAALPLRSARPGVSFSIDKNFAGLFNRTRRGGVVFRYVDLGSSCCVRYPVEKLNAVTLRVRFEPVNEGNPGIRIRGSSRWRWARGPHDWTGQLALGPRPRRV
jgi:hypothetical protein